MYELCFRQIFDEIMTLYYREFQLEAIDSTETQEMSDRVINELRRENTSYDNFIPKNKVYLLIGIVIIRIN